MKRQMSAATTVGSAHGSSTAVRTRPRARVTRSSRMASTRPRDSSTDTLVTTKTVVWPSALQKRASRSTSA